MEPYPNPYNPPSPYYPSQPPSTIQQPYSYPSQPNAGFPPALTQAPAKPTGRIAFTRGLLFGFLLVLVVAAWITAVSIPSPLENAISAASSADPFGISSLFVSLLISLVQGIFAWIIFYFAGRSGARAGGKFGTGMVTCLWAALWYLLADLLGFLLLATITAASTHDPSYIINSLPGIQQPFAIDAFLAFIGLGFGAAGANKGAPRLSR